jgi:hypothetical protein
MADAQVWLVSTLAGFTGVARLMHAAWVWPAAESLHFIGLSLLVGTIGLFDLRLLGFARRVPILAMHRLVPWGLLGFAVNDVTGAAFLMAEPDQYVYNPAFQLKLLFIAVAGLNALTFYWTSYSRVAALNATAGPQQAPRAARIVAAVSLSLWMFVIVAGRLLTFYRPFPCGPAGPGIVATCIPGDFGGAR